MNNYLDSAIKFLKEFGTLIVVELIFVLISTQISIIQNIQDKISFLILIIIICILIAIIFSLYKKINRISEIGVFEILDSTIEGPGSTTNILKEVTQDFSFMGIAARKWIGTGTLLEEKIRTVGARTGKVRFLILNPFSQEAIRLSLSQEKDKNYLTNLIIDSLNFFKKFKSEKMNIEVRLYDFLPTFRIAITNTRKIYVAFYRSDSYIDDTPQIVFINSGKINFFTPFAEYFENVWNDKNTFELDLNRLDDSKYLDEIKSSVYNNQY